MKINRELLIIDDEILILDLLKESLSGIIDNVSVAQNGEVGVEILLNNKNIDCVICDIRMPVLNGVETIKKCRALGIETPFIFYTGFGDDQVFKEVAKYGIFDFLEKPKLENLIETVKRGIEYNFVNHSTENNVADIIDILEES